MEKGNCHMVPSILRHALLHETGERWKRIPSLLLVEPGGNGGNEGRAAENNRPWLSNFDSSTMHWSKSFSIDCRMKCTNASMNPNSRIGRLVRRFQ